MKQIVECKECKYSNDTEDECWNAESIDSAVLTLHGKIIGCPCGELKTPPTVRKVMTELSNCKECEFAEIEQGEADSCGNPAFDELKIIEVAEGIPDWCPRLPYLKE